jgi:hypothetical protein
LLLRLVGRGNVPANDVAHTTATGKKIKRCGGPGCDKIIYFDSSSDLPDDPEIRDRAVRGIYNSRDYCSTNCRVKRWQRDQKDRKN